MAAAPHVPQTSAASRKFADAFFPSPRLSASLFRNITWPAVSMTFSAPLGGNLNSLPLALPTPSGSTASTIRLTKVL
jgi:hypothetical protein